MTAVFRWLRRLFRDRVAEAAAAPSPRAEAIIRDMRDRGAK